MSSKITMPADSTQNDDRRSTSRRSKKIPDRKKVKKTKKIDSIKKVIEILSQTAKMPTGLCCCCGCISVIRLHCFFANYPSVLPSAVK